MAAGRKTGGREVGTPNKINKEFRQTVTMLLESNADNVSRWMEQVASGDEDLGIKADPGRALDLLSKLAEFASPKLSRTELTNPDGGTFKVEVVQFGDK